MLYGQKFWANKEVIAATEAYFANIQKMYFLWVKRTKNERF